MWFKCDHGAVCLGEEHCLMTQKQLKGRLPFHFQENHGLQGTVDIIGSESKHFSCST